MPDGSPYACWRSRRRKAKTSSPPIRKSPPPNFKSRLEFEPVKTIPVEEVAQITEKLVDAVVELPPAPVPDPLTEFAPQVVAIVKPSTWDFEVDRTETGNVTQASLPAVRLPTG